MAKHTPIFIAMGIIIGLGLLWGLKSGILALGPQQADTIGTRIATTSVNLAVPFTSEVPEGKWTPPWNNACEEAAIAMVDGWYKGTTSFTVKEAIAAMNPFFEWQNKTFGSNADSNATRTARIIEENTSFTATVVRSPTLEAIKEQLRAGHPVITFHYGYDLHNPAHRWARNGSYYHVMTLTGFDDEKGQFLVNDSALEKGLDYRYSYATIMDSLHDFDHGRKKADGLPTVLFTKAK